MPCLFPIQSYFSEGTDGKKVLSFSSALARGFSCGSKSIADNVISLPCGRCMSCRLERSRQVALRCVHEAKMYEDNCFITLTFDDEHLAKMCPMTEGGYSLVRKHTQDFVKRLRERFDQRIRVFGCGEYGDKNFRPHYHFCLFNCDFKDKVKFKKVNGFWHYTSDLLSSVWSLDDKSIGFALVTSFSFETAAYVARYCCAKVTGDAAAEHYKGRLPEFPVYSNRPGLGKPWFDKFGVSDVISSDSCISRGVRCKVPRYYDKLYERIDPEGFIKVKLARIESAKLNADDNTYDRLRTKEKCMNARIRLLVRSL